jgi:lipoprotein-anchoring transpeptidase ErfK/SrfK
MPRISDQQANKFGVGESGEGRHWRLYDGELSLYDEKSQQTVYRKSLEPTDEAPTPPVLEDEPIALPPIDRFEGISPDFPEETLGASFEPLDLMGEPPQLDIEEGLRAPTLPDQNIEDLMKPEGGAPAWMRRALDPDSSWLDAEEGGGESIKTVSVEADGREILFPTIRRADEVVGDYPIEFERTAADGTVFVELPIDEAIEQAKKQGDFLEFDSPDKATEFSKKLSDLAGRKSEIQTSDREIQLADPEGTQEALQDQSFRSESDPGEYEVPRFKAELPSMASSELTQTPGSPFLVASADEFSNAFDLLPSPIESQTPQMPEESEIQISSPAPIEENARAIEMAVKSSPNMVEILSETARDIGTTPSTADSIIVTDKALSNASSPMGPYSLVINPNTNKAQLLDEGGNVIKIFPVGTGDITGTQYGKPYFSPVGDFSIKNEVPYEQMEGGYGPMWMGLTVPKYGLHGPHQQSSLLEGDEGFINRGYVSHGCIRFREEDILEVAKYLDVGASVKILPYWSAPSSAISKGY